MEEKQILQDDDKTTATSTDLPKKITKENFIKNTKQDRILGLCRTAFYLLLSSLLISIATHCLIGPNEFTVGGVAGIAIMIAYVTKGAFPQSAALLCVNLPLLILAFIVIKRKFAFLTISNILMQSLWLLLLENVGNLQIVFDPSMKMFAAVAGGVCIGAAVAFAFKVGGSTGGVDIVAVLIQKKFPAPSIAKMIFIVNAIVISVSFFVYYKDGETIAVNLMPIIMVLFESYVESKTNDSLTSGFQSALEFRIITDKPEELSIALMRELSRGVTSVAATGMYTKETHAMLICVISRRQVATLRRVMKQVDPNAFAVMSNVSQVLGLGFFSSEN